MYPENIQFKGSSTLECLRLRYQHTLFWVKGQKGPLPERPSPKRPIPKRHTLKGYQS